MDGTGYSVVFSGDSSNHLGLAKSDSYTPSAGPPESFHRVVHNHLGDLLRYIWDVHQKSRDDVTFDLRIHGVLHVFF